MIRRPPRSTQGVSSAASDVYKRQGINAEYMGMYNAIELRSLDLSMVNERLGHTYSMSLMMLFLGVSLALFLFNKYPSEVFVGDTYTYFAGMVFAVSGILGHFTKTFLLFFIPQIINFLLSLPQLLGAVKCPRHRLPKLNQLTYRLECVHHHFNLVNGVLRILGPTNEKQTVNVLLLFQIVCCVFGLILRYSFSNLLFR
eukprot:TRINITY_DN28015_c0_g1_i4.p1 TRINITY_DN28015_c0_g1~~TRINITY_DN28015_c0_g1_i4.p1  ORF type:complete len:199 (+),score=22.06 TRINITY_DN28015_c0_g1_i4:121-717(+)